MFSIDTQGRIKVGDRYRGTVNSPGKIHPEAMELVERWKELRKLADEIDKNLFQVSAGHDFEDVSIAVRFSVPENSWKAADRLDKDLRTVSRDVAEQLNLLGSGADSMLEASVPIDTPRPMEWSLSILLLPEVEVSSLAGVLGYLADAVRSTRLEEFAQIS